MPEQSRLKHPEQLNHTNTSEKFLKPTNKYYAYYNNYMEIELYKYNYQLTKFLVLATSNSPSVLKYITINVKTLITHIASLIYNFHIEEDYTIKLKQLKEIKSNYARLSFECKLMYDIKIINMTSQVEIAEYIGWLSEETDNIAAKIHKKIKSKNSTFDDFY